MRPGVTHRAARRDRGAGDAAAGAIPSFKGYGGFPATLCTSVNDEIVHGIPSPRRVLREGDLIKIDAGAILEGYHADSAATWIVGGDDAAPPEVARLVAGHARRAVGRPARRPPPTRAWATSRPRSRREALPYGYGVVREYVGHGIGRALHEDPQVPNYGSPAAGSSSPTGLVLASSRCSTWARTTRARSATTGPSSPPTASPSAHWEHTVAITPDGPWVLTAREDETALAAAASRTAFRPLAVPSDSAATISAGPPRFAGAFSALHAQARRRSGRPPTTRKSTVKVKPSVKRICEKCRIIRRHGRVMVICDEPPAQAAAGLRSTPWHVSQASTCRARSARRSA